MASAENFSECGTVGQRTAAIGSIQASHKSSNEIVQDKCLQRATLSHICCSLLSPQFLARSAVLLHCGSVAALRQFGMNGKATTVKHPRSM
mmetsp:Transcript_86040/g.229609  ORF Transcript_86040/g.229609 Transcript_86040/m.229609 type:complete len:91 (+) Transcript_86040:548-820(+)